MKTEIFIDRIKFFAYHGVLPHERREGQEFEVSLRLDVEGYDGSDNLDSTVNYAEVINVVKEQMNIPSNLLEHVAARIAREVKSQFSQVAAVEVTVTKLHPPVPFNLSGASVTITARRPEAAGSINC